MFARANHILPAPDAREKVGDGRVWSCGIMVTTEGDRLHTSATSPFERQTQTPAAPSSAEAAAEQQRGLEQTSIPLRDPLHNTSRVVAGTTIVSMFGLGALVLAILGLSGVAATHILSAAGIVLAP